MNRIEIPKEKSIYADIGGFKGNTFQNNINSINRLYYGQGLKISDTLYLHRNEKDNKYYLSANKIEIKPKGGQKSQLMYFPDNFLNQVFLYNNNLFFICQDYKLLIFSLKNQSIKKYTFSPKSKEGQTQETQHKNEEKDEIKEEEEKKEKKEKKVKKENDNQNENFNIKINEIFTKLAKINTNLDIKSNYEIFCDILSHNLAVNLNEKLQRFNGKKIYEIKIDDFEVEIVYEKILEEVDSVGQIRKKLKLANGIISLETGIKSLKEYINSKRDKDKSKQYIDNDFKCPILFKNFVDEFIPENSVILCEIKSGFALLDVMKQLNKRIDIIKYCLFNKFEKPNYFIGIINLNSENVEKLDDFLEKKYQNLMEMY